VVGGLGTEAFVFRIRGRIKIATGECVGVRLGGGIRRGKREGRAGGRNGRVGDRMQIGSRGRRLRSTRSALLG
jgi:hypothetical protein